MIELAELRRELMTLGQLGREGGVVEDRLHRALAVVEVAAEPEDGEVVAGLRDHLQLLQGRDAGVGIVDADAGVGAIGEAVERRHAGVAAGRHQDEEVEVGGAPGVRLLERLAEVQRHALQRHVLEGQRGPVPELEHVPPRSHFAHRRDLRVVEVRAVGPWPRSRASSRRRRRGRRPRTPPPPARGTAASARATICSTVNRGSRSGTNRPPPGAMPSRMASVNVRGLSMTPRVSRYRIMATGFYRNAGVRRAPRSGGRSVPRAGPVTEPRTALDISKRCITIYRVTAVMNVQGGRYVRVTGDRGPPVRTSQ